jgi:thiamine biosynthesis lipoprotein
MNPGACRAVPPAQVLIPPLPALHRSPPATPVLSLQGRSMGCGWSVRLAGPARADAASIQQLVQGELDRLDQLLSHWNPASTLCAFGRAPAGTWFPLPEAFHQVMAIALQAASLTSGAFDPGLADPVQRWGFGPGRRFDDPDYSPPQTAGTGWGDWRSLVLDEGAPALRQPGGYRLDLSAVAKGFAVDRLCELLHSLGWRHYLVELGGELRAAGCKPDAQPWWVDLEWPPGGTVRPNTRVALLDLAVASSGDYRQFMDRDGKRLSHTLDPASGAPVENGLAAVSVLHPRCAWADALSTALMVLGLERGMNLARDQGWAARFVNRDADGQLHEHLSPHLQAWMA